MIEPPNRSSLWRLPEFSTRAEPNYDDNALFCGGKMNLAFNGGKCGVCGDPYQGPYKNEAGGIYAQGIIARTYEPGQNISVKIQIMANHRGWFEFRLCVNNNISQKITHACLDKHLLETSDLGLTSKQSGELEEEYYGCSDIAIQKSNTPPNPSLSYIIKTTVRQPRSTLPGTPVTIYRYLPVEENVKLFYQHGKETHTSITGVLFNVEMLTVQILVHSVFAIDFLSLQNMPSKFCY
ncbi:unnamed protein product [Mytilus coruscus]|uniref:Chitin-binding type-4 domain-containing protein n=1 Tax=Mytilus coruscus TaxID=42192 RepID=A0A6J8CL87_MYTCO|nr:unnamed protein product [Mytilus coruscus]